MSRSRLCLAIILACGLSGPVVAAGATDTAPASPMPESVPHFTRVATFPVFRNQEHPGQETVAEIVAAGKDGHMLVYTDGETGELGFVDISDPAAPQPAGTVAIGGEPTSVAVAGGYALVVTNTSASYTDTSGQLVVVDMASRDIVARHALGGQPDSIDVSPDGRFAAIAIENERDEDVNDGMLPQMPAGWLTVVTLSGQPDAWQLERVDLRGIAQRFPKDPEPEYVNINADNIAALTLQENNHIVLVDLAKAAVVNDFNAGTVDLAGIDTQTDGMIVADDSLDNVRREPDGIAWVGTDLIATADEGDLVGGSRGFTLFNRAGDVHYTADNALEQTAIRLGHFPEATAGEEGIQPENVVSARYGDIRMLVVGAEKANLLYVYYVDSDGLPHFVQALPTGVAPEGLLALPQRGLLVAANEEDDAEDGIRSSLSIYAVADTATYPQIAASKRTHGKAIAWGALSALAIDPAQPDVGWTVNDSAFALTHIYRIDLSSTPARITDAIRVTDADGILAAKAPQLVDAGGHVNLDAEGIDTRPGGGFWLASEGNGSVTPDSEDYPVETPNLLLAVSAQGVIEQVIPLPDAVDARQDDHGFEGVAVVDTPDGESVYVAFQRPWAGDPAGTVRIGRYNVATQTWAFARYPLDTSASSATQVGLSDLVNLGDGRLGVIERDGQNGADAAIKRVYVVNVANAEFQSVDAGAELPRLDKTLAADLIPALRAANGVVPEKVEGLATIGGDAVIVTDNDGYGETRLLRLDAAFKQ